jgi:Ribonuclease III domain
LREMVVLESAIISNEVLAFIAAQTGLHRYLQHKDHSLPSRIEGYICSIREDGRGLWSTGTTSFVDCRRRWWTCRIHRRLFFSLLDPPKVIADIVESLIGAIYVDGGLEAGMEAARTLLKPVLDVLLTDGEYIDLVHPKKKLQELVGELLVVETTWEDTFHQKILLLDGSSLRPADPYGTQGIGYVSFMDTILVAVSDSSRAVARNKACAIIVQVLTSDLNLLQRLQNLRYMVESNTTARSSMSGKPVAVDD